MTMRGTPGGCDARQDELIALVWLGEESKEFALHLANCPACAEAVAAERALATRSRAAARAAGAGAGSVADAVLAKTTRRQSADAGLTRRGFGKAAWAGAGSLALAGGAATLFLTTRQGEELPADLDLDLAQADLDLLSDLDLAEELELLEWLDLLEAMNDG